MKDILAPSPEEYLDYCQLYKTELLEKWASD